MAKRPRMPLVMTVKAEGRDWVMLFHLEKIGPKIRVRRIADVQNTTRGTEIAALLSIALIARRGWGMKELLECFSAEEATKKGLAAAILLRGTQLEQGIAPESQAVKEAFASGKAYARYQGAGGAPCST